MTLLHQSLQMSTPVLTASAAPQVLYALVEVGVTVPTVQRAPIHWCLVVDCSPSMRVPVANEAMFRELLRRGLASEVVVDGMPVWKIAGGIPDDLKGQSHSPTRSVIQAVGSIAERLAGNDRLTVIGFAASTHTLLVHADPRDQAALRAMIPYLERGDFGDATRLAPALEQARALLHDHHERGRADRVLVITDGFVADEQSTLAFAEIFADEGCTVTTLGIGIDFQESLLLALADHTGGRAVLINDPRQIPAALDRELDHAGRIAAFQARLDLRLAQGVSLRRVFRVRPTLAELNLGWSEHSGSIMLGALEPHAPPVLLLELLAPSRGPGTYRLLRTSAHALSAAGADLAANPLDMVVEYKHGAQPTINANLRPLLDRVAAWRSHTRALDTLASGSPEATNQLQAAVTRLLSVGEESLANQTARLAEDVANGTFDSGAAKSLRYATRRLTAASPLPDAAYSDSQDD